MKLSFAMICEYLTEKLAVTPTFLQYAEGETELFGMVDAADEGLQDGYVSLSDACGNGVITANCIITGGVIPETADKGHNLMVLPPEVERSAAEKALKDCFGFYNRWQEELLEKIITGEDWDSLLESGHRLLKNPMIIYDIGMRVLSYTKDDGSEDKLWKDTVEAGMASTATMHESDELLKYVRRFETDNKPFKHHGEGMTDPFYSCNIVLHSGRCGMVTLMEHNHEVSRGETDIVRIYSSLLALKMQNEYESRPSREENYRQLLIDLLEGSITSRQRLNTRLAAAGWAVQNCFVVMQFSKSLSYITDTQWKLALEDFGHMGLDGICCMINEPSPVICAVSSLRDAEQFSLLRRRIQDYCRANHLLCGVSDVFEDLIQVPRYWDQAVSALELGTETLNEYSALRHRRMLEYLTECHYPEDLLSHEVLLLKRADEESGTEYCATLYALCSCLFSQTAASAKLNIHRTTLNYRLQKIKELTGLELEDNEKMLHVWMSLKMLDMQ